MGVKSLWQLLEPVGKRINIEALQGKKLAVGALQCMSQASAVRPVPPWMMI